MIPQNVRNARPDNPSTIRDRVAHAAEVGQRAQSKPTIRPARAADRVFIADLGKRSIVDSVAAFRYASPPMLELNYERLLDVVYSQSHIALIADVEGRPAGFALMLDALPDEVTGTPQGFIAYMAVEPECRERGVGSALLDAAENEARRRKLPYMGLMVTEDNVAARRLYERAGYFTERRLLCKTL